MIKKQGISIFWFRRDLRLFDNAGLYHALKSNFPVLPLFIFDKNILDELDDPSDRRITFIHQALENLQEQLTKLDSTLLVKYGTSLEIFKQLANEFDIQAVFTNHDYEPYAIQRDKLIATIFQEKGIAFHTFKDQCIFEKNEILSNSNTPYTIFTPYSRKWKEKLNQFYLKAYPNEKYYNNFIQKQTISPEFKPEIIPLEAMNFKQALTDFPSKSISDELIQQYKQKRDFPAQKGTSRLSVHLRFGTISIRQLAAQAKDAGETFLNELIWRDFYMMILWHFPHVVTKSFKPAYDDIPWRNNETEFQQWCNGKTGYPIVDAGMRELNETGFMHNRVRMITASFLTKHLLIDWRRGEAYFAKKLLDYDLSANNGGWQWAASSGCDAAPYFRVFNPYEQTKKFDPDFAYIKKWVPEFNDFTYRPIVEHKFARERVLKVFKATLQKTESS